VAPYEGLRPILDESEVMAVAEAGPAHRKHYGSPQDTEWAFDPEGKLWMLQSLPITALHDEDALATAVTTGTAAQSVLLRGLAAVRQVWDQGHRNLHVMLPFVRTTEELRRCRELVGESGLLARRGFELWVMAEVPSVLFNLADYAALGLAGVSIGSNDLTQLLLGADRDNEVLADTFDERDPAVTAYLRELIPRARALGLRTSICGQAPSVHPEYAKLLVRAGIDAISVNVDAASRTRALVTSAERRVLLDFARAHGTPDAPPSV
jgi:phosphoenolpyruvate synthase/pyruvate phosphate dikinase